MKNILFIAFVGILLSGCLNSKTESKENIRNDELPIDINESKIQKKEKIKLENLNLKEKPKVDVKIKINDSILKYGEKIMLKVTLTNNQNYNQKMLFDKPEISTGGPWATTGTVINLKNNKSVLKHECKAMLSSQLYTEENLKDKYYNLIPKQSISAKYNLTDIVSFDYSENLLKSGTYKIQIFYHSNPSNVLTLTVQ